MMGRSMPRVSSSVICRLLRSIFGALYRRQFSGRYDIDRRVHPLIWTASIMKIKPLLPVAILAVAFAALIAAFAADGNLMQQMNPNAAQSRIQGDLSSLGGATGWLNSAPLAASSLRGKA